MTARHVDFFVLDDADRPVRCRDRAVWTRWMANSVPQRSVARHEVGPYLITTTFDGVAFSDEKPRRLFTTRICETAELHGRPSQEVWRWATREEGLTRHLATVDALREQLERLGSRAEVVDLKLAAEAESEMHML